MSTEETETPEVENPDAEPVEPITGDDEDAEEEEAAQTPAEAADEYGSAESARLLEEAAHAHHKKLQKIYGDALPAFVCPLCEGYGVVEPGVEALDVFAWDETTELCPRCNGLGQLRRHTRADGHLLGVCTDCGGNGWRTKSAPAQNVYPMQPTAPVATPTNGPVQYGYTDQNGIFVPFVPAQSQ